MRFGQVFWNTQLEYISPVHRQSCFISPHVAKQFFIEVECYFMTALFMTNEELSAIKI